jgi:lactate dehydrogenase-like 2-hydroxyacid dehydrogenase
MSHHLEREADTAFLPHSDQWDGVEARLILRGCTPTSFNVASTDPNNEISGAIPEDALANAVSVPFASRVPRPSLKYLELLLPAEIDFDHTDLSTAAAAGHIVAQVTGSNAVSVVEDQLRCPLFLTCNFLSSHH